MPGADRKPSRRATWSRVALAVSLASVLAWLFGGRFPGLGRQGAVASGFVDGQAALQRGERQSHGSPASSGERKSKLEAGLGLRGAARASGEVRSGDDAFLRGLDPLDALTVLDGMQTADAAFLFEAYSLVLEPGLSGGDRRAIRGILETVPRADVAWMLIAAFSDVWARTDPAGTAAWIASLPAKPDQARLLGDVMTTWAAREPERAAEFAAALPAGEARRLALQSAVRQWRTSDLASAGEWLVRAGSHPDFDVAVAALSLEKAARLSSAGLRRAVEHEGSTAR